MAAETKTITGVLLLLLALPVSSAAQANERCGIEARGGVVFPSHDALEERGPSIGVGFSCDTGPRFGLGGGIEYEVSDDAGQFRFLGTGRMLLIGDPGGGALVLRGHAGIVKSFEAGVRLVAPFPPDFTGTTFNWEATGPSVGGGVRATVDLGGGWLGFIEGSVRTALLNVRNHWEAGERVETESIFVTSYPLTAGLAVRF